MNGYEKAQSLGLTGNDAEKVAVLRTIANLDISRIDLASWLARKGLLDFDGDGWFGLLQEKIIDGTITGELLLLLRKLKSVCLAVGSESLRTTTPPYCVHVFAGLSGIADAVPEVAALCAEFYDVLDGGRPYKDLTVDQFVEQRGAAVASSQHADLINSLRSRFNSALNQVGNSEQWLAVTELRLMADELEA